MTKAELVETVANGRGVTKKLVNSILDEAFEVIGQAVASDGRFVYPGFGVWERRWRKARSILHPVTSRKMRLRPFLTVRFRASRVLKGVL